jgi:hypothetical protein
MRDWLTISCVCLLVLGVIGSIIHYQLPPSGVFACSDKVLNPPEIQKQCLRLTKGQWWNK